MNWDYIAGFFDGEGNLYYVKKPSGYAARVAITQNDISPLLEIKTFLYKNKIDSIIYRNEPKGKPEKHRLIINGYLDILEFLKNMREIVIVKKNKVEEIIKTMSDHPVHHVKLRNWQEDEVEELLREKIPYEFIRKKMNLKTKMGISRVRKERNTPYYNNNYERYKGSMK